VTDLFAGVGGSGGEEEVGIEREGEGGREGRRGGGGVTELPRKGGRGVEEGNVP
jgi:hypothetical protein